MPGLSICTASAPWKPLDELIPLLKAAGYDGVEIGLNQGAFDPVAEPNPWNNNAAVLRWDGGLEEARRIKGLLDEHGLRCAAIGSYVETDDITRVAQAAEIAHALDCEFIRVRVPWYRTGTCYRTALEEARSCYRDLSVLSAETGIDSLIEIHDNSICPTASAAMRVLEGLDPTHVGVIFDPGNFIGEGLESIPMAIDILGPYLRHVHVKNAAVELLDESTPKGVKWKGAFSGLADGALDWAKVVGWLQEAGYDGWYSLENFAGASRGPDGLKPDADWLRGLVGATAPA